MFSTITYYVDCHLLVTSTHKSHNESVTTTNTTKSLHTNIVATLTAQPTDVTRPASDDNGARFSVGTASPHLPIHQYDWFLMRIRLVQSACVRGAIGARSQRLTSHRGVAW